MVIRTMHSFETLWYLLLFLMKHGGGYWFIACQKWVIEVFSSSDKWFYPMLAKNTHLQSLLVFVFMLNKQDSKWLPQELVRKQNFVYSTFLVKSSADIFHSSVVEHSLFPGCWTVLSQHSYYKMTKWPLVEWEVTECAWWRKWSYSRIQQIFLWF